MTDTGHRPSWSRRHPRVAKACALVVGLVLAEAACRVMTELGALPFRRQPTTHAPTFWDDLSPSWGVWHHPNATLHHVAPCYDVRYRTNAHGMRDPPRELRSSAARRVVVLGDSFVEGYGVADGLRMTDVLERRSGVEHLNFGTAGDFSTVQQWLVYRDLARRFDHSEVMVFVLPFNDARENDPSRFPPDRYRPYLVRGADGALALHYPVAFAARRLERRGPLAIAHNVFSNHCRLYGLARIVGGALLEDPSGWLLYGEGGASYESYGEFDLECLREALARIHELAGGRIVRVFTIPTRFDFEAARAGCDEFVVPEALRAFAAAHEGVVYVDLLPHFVADARAQGREYLDYVLRCDGHWNPLGHRVAADAVAASLAH